MSGTTVAQAVADLKEYYSSDQVLNSTILKHNPLFGLCSKDPGVSGEFIPVPIQSSGSGGVGTNFTTAQGYITASVYRKFQVPFTSIYSVARVSGQAQMASRNNAGAFKDLLKAETDAAMMNATNLIAAYMWRDGTGTLGQINASYATDGNITFTNLTDAQFFWAGLPVSASASPGATPRAGVGFVTAVDRSAGTMTVSTSLGGVAGNPTGWAASDYIQIAGTFNNVFPGLTSWLPYTAATRPGTSQSALVNQLFGVDRSIDPVAYAGTWYNGASEQVMDACIDGLSEIERNGGSPKVLITNPVTLRGIVKELSGKREYVEAIGPTGVGYKGIEIFGDTGPIALIGDRNCPAKTIFALDTDMVELDSYDKAPQMLTFNGGNDFFVYNDDSVELRIGAYLNMIVKKPQSCGVISTNV